MKKYFIGLLFTTLFLARSNAQHCEYDFAAIIVVKPTTGSSDSLIKGLQITLLDSTGKIYKEVWHNDTLFFWQNPERTTQTGYIDNNNPLRPEKIRFPFAKNNYVVVCDRQIAYAKMKIKIEDTDGIKNGGEFLTQVISIKPEDVFPLCTEHSDWKRNKDFKYEHTINVSLNKK